MNVFERFRNALAVFRGRDRPGNITQFSPGYGTGGNGSWFGGPSSSDRPDRLRLRPGNEKTIINSAWNRIALDVAQVEMHHAKVDENGSFLEIIPGDLEEFMNTEANIDQTSMAYTIDLVMSMFDEGVVAEVPVVADRKADGEIKSLDEMRIGKIVDWKPELVQVELYNQITGKKERTPVYKKEICIHENPFYSVMNQKNSIFQRLVRKLAILDIVDEKAGSDKVNMILQLPYIVRTDQKRAEAKARIADLEQQLTGSKYGMAYVDGTEKIIQLNRPVENTLQAQIEWLTDLFFSQLGITREILNGTADEKAMTNYLKRVVGVICDAIVAERRRKLLTKNQRKNGESIVYTQDPFKLIPVTNIADIFDKLLRNAILSPNEARGIVGYKPSDDETADQLVNRNMPIKQTPGGAETDEGEAGEGGEPVMLHSAFVVGSTRKKQPKRLPLSKRKTDDTG